jgi:hypothetical protein
MTREEQAAIDYLADVLSGASALQIAKSLETAEFHFRNVPECDRGQAIFNAAVKAVAIDLTQIKFRKKL